MFNISFVSIFLFSLGTYNTACSALFRSDYFYRSHETCEFFHLYLTRLSLISYAKSNTMIIIEIFYSYLFLFFFFYPSLKFIIVKRESQLSFNNFSLKKFTDARVRVFNTTIRIITLWLRVFTRFKQIIK